MIDNSGIVQKDPTMKIDVLCKHCGDCQNLMIQMLNLTLRLLSNRGEVPPFSLILYPQKQMTFAFSYICCHVLVC